MGDLISQLITCREALWHRSLSSCLSGLQVTSNLCGHIQMLSWTVLLVGPGLGPQNWKAEQSAKSGSAADPLRCSCTGLGPERPLLTHSVLQRYPARWSLQTPPTGQCCFYGSEEPDCCCWQDSWIRKNVKYLARLSLWIEKYDLLLDNSHPPAKLQKEIHKWLIAEQS